MLLDTRRLKSVFGVDHFLVPLGASPRRLVYQLREVERPSGTLFREERATPPRVALFLKGGGVQEGHGIRPGLAGEALIQYERMFIEQALRDERDAARIAGRQRRPRGSPFPGLLFTGTPRGSFGLEFVPRHAEDEGLLNLHARSLQNVANALVQVSSSDRSLDELVGEIPPGVLRSMKKFFNILAQHGAELRVAFSAAPSQSITSERIQSASDRLERELEEEDLLAKGVFRGLTRESLVFDLLGDDGNVTTGTVADDLTEDDLDRIDALTNKRCLARLRKQSIRQVGGGSRETYLLLDAKSEEEAIETIETELWR
ncbi:MAG TPA: hypothetical protein VNH11_07940 [Pirellulales bacterium]|nr:hypothetical protein [Pirellulales bacterium]